MPSACFCNFRLKILSTTESLSAERKLGASRIGSIAPSLVTRLAVRFKGRESTYTMKSIGTCAIAVIPIESITYVEYNQPDSIAENHFRKGPFL